MAKAHGRNLGINVTLEPQKIGFQQGSTNVTDPDQNKT